MRIEFILNLYYFEKKKHCVATGVTTGMVNKTMNFF